jgi:hypothetical protein
MSDELPSGEHGTLRDPSQLPKPVLWPEPAPGEQPVPMHGREQGGPEEEIAKRRLPLAWTAIGILVVAVVLLGVAVGRHSLILLGTGVVIGVIGGALALKSRIMEAATVGQSAKDD